MAEPATDTATEVADARLDLRLVLPALLAWAVLTALITGPAWVMTAVAVVAGLAATALARSRRWAGAGGVVHGQVALGLAAVALVCLAGAAHVARDRAGR